MSHYDDISCVLVILQNSKRISDGDLSRKIPFRLVYSLKRHIDLDLEIAKTIESPYIIYTNNTKRYRNTLQ